MSRKIDKFPEIAPQDRRKLKVVVLSPSRSGTMGLWKALKMLGYRAYHVVETLDLGTEHHRVAIEAMVASNNRMSGIKPYTRADFDKWLGAYDAVLEFPSCMIDDYLDAYLPDEDVKFILTERDPDRWVRSMNNTLAQFIIGLDSFPMSLFRRFSEPIDSFPSVAAAIYSRFSDGTYPGKGHSEEALRRNYMNYIQKVKARVPADRLKVINLDENGLDWDDFCPFLGHEIPSQPYPRANDPEEFKKIGEDYMGPYILKVMAGMGAMLVPILAGALYWAYGDSKMV